MLPDVMLKQDEDIFLDDYTPAELADGCAMPVIVGEATGRGLAGVLASVAAVSDGAAESMRYEK